MLIVSGRVDVNPAKRDEAVKDIQAVVDATVTEEGCVHYAFYSDVLAPNSFRVFEIWTSEEALDAHLAAPHTQNFLAKVGNWVQGDVKVERFIISEVKPL